MLHSFSCWQLESRSICLVDQAIGYIHRLGYKAIPAEWGQISWIVGPARQRSWFEQNGVPEYQFGQPSTNRIVGSHGRSAV